MRGKLLTHTILKWCFKQRKMAAGPLTYDSHAYCDKWGRSVCAYVLCICVSVQATDRFLQAFISPNLREKQLLLRLCIPTSMCKRNVKCKQLLLANVVPFYLSSFLCFLYFSTFFFCCSVFFPAVSLCVSHFPSSSQMLPSSTSSTARPLRTLRSCARLAPMPSLYVRTPPRLALPHRLLPADLFLPYPLSRTPTRWPTQAPSPVSKACLSLSPPGVKAGLPPHVYPSVSHSQPRCGASCRGSGTVRSWRSSQRTRGDCRR